MRHVCVLCSNLAHTYIFSFVRWVLNFGILSHHATSLFLEVIPWKIALKMVTSPKHIGPPFRRINFQTFTSSKGHTAYLPIKTLAACFTRNAQWTIHFSNRLDTLPGGKMMCPNGASSVKYAASVSLLSRKNLTSAPIHMTWFGCEISLITEFRCVQFRYIVYLFIVSFLVCKIQNVENVGTACSCSFDVNMIILQHLLTSPFSWMLQHNQKPMCFLLRTLCTNMHTHRCKHHSLHDDNTTKSSFTFNTLFITRKSEPNSNPNPYPNILLSNECTMHGIK